MKFTEVERLLCHADEAFFWAVGAEVHASENVCLGACEFVLDESVAQEFLDFGNGKCEGGLELVRLGCKGDTPVHAVFVKIGGGIDGVGEAFVFADFLEESACHAGAHRYVENREGATVTVTHVGTVKTESPKKVRLRDVAFLDNLHAAFGCVDVFWSSSANLLLFKFLCTKFYKFFVIHFARSKNVQRNFVGDLVSVLEHLLACEGFDLLDVPGDGVRDAATFKVYGIENVSNKFFGNVVVAMDFLDDDMALFFHFFFVEARVHEHVRNDVNGKRCVAAFDLCVKACLLAGGVRFEISAAVFDGVRDFECGAVFCSFKNEMLVKMAQPEFVFGFVAASSRNPDAHGCGVGVRHVIG